ncbi:MAG TPA: hypothetical protein VFW53_07610 [Gallionella sp.]|nr:hypothetical protein [Gallionella sp.]
MTADTPYFDLDFALIEHLNQDCHSAALDRDALQQAMREQGEAWHNLVTERCPHLFADVPVFISAAQLQRMRDVIAAVERVAALNGWQQRSLPSVIPAQAGIQTIQKIPGNAGTKSTALLINPLDSGLRRITSDLPACGLSRMASSLSNDEVRSSAKGVFFGYDFHLNEQGAHLIEINTNAGGGYLNALLLDSQRDAGLPGEAVAEENLDQVFLAMFRSEWRLARGDAPLKSIVIVDEQPEGQYLYPEFLLAKKQFERAGIAAHIADPAALKAKADGLYLESSGGEQKIDLVYNRLTDFSLQQYEALRQAYLAGQVALTPHPQAYEQYADKRNLARLTDAEALRALGADEADIATLQAGVPHTLAVREEMDGALWAERKHLFFKPNSGYGSKGAYRGANLTKRVFGEILHGDYVAQQLAPPGERSVCVDDAEAAQLKFDVRCYVYDGQIQLVAARLYQGQTTNFRTPGGGFAPVRLLR